ncbi:Response regulator receiver domain-containing protein [Shimia gijangensis]|uniref:Response regulator receiver domain-containing protein n=1 Tax=Shimia gijangensis TaxID=1470563 RepID=A0A1M6BML3_9RHOB|nr:response regulator [Shimia gijangensis]SHI49961.1 Response regulator receiver domain-containing protein [Shimia gijangensis]
MKILIVDDEPDIQVLLTFFLEAMGHTQVVTASSAFEALKIVESSEIPFDMFMLDIQMPNMSGIELCQVLRAMPEYRFKPILMVTAMSDKKYVDTAFAAGATDYLNKPFDELELKHRLGLAERATFHERQVAKDAQTISDTLAHEPLANPYDLSNAVPIDDVNGVMRVHAFESYLKHLRVLQFQKTHFFCGEC